MRVLALVTGIVLLLAAGVLFLAVVTTVISGTAMDTDTRLGLALFLAVAAVIAVAADLLIIAAVRQPPAPRLAAGTGTDRASNPKWAAWLLSPLLIAIVVTATFVIWLATGFSRVRPQPRTPAARPPTLRPTAATGPLRDPQTARRTPPLLKWEQFLAMTLVQGGSVLAFLFVVRVVTHWSSLTQLPRDAASLLPFVAALLVGVALLWIMVVLRRRRDQRRLADIAAWAPTVNFAVESSGGPAPNWAGRLYGIHPRQRNGRLDLLLTGSRRNRRCAVADYTYEIHPEQEYVEGIGVLYPVPVVLTIVVVTMRLTYPGARVNRRGVSSRLLRAFTRPAANGVAEGTFDMLFQVSGPDAPRLHEVASPAMASRIVAAAVSWMDLGGHELILAWNGRLRLGQIQAALEESCAIADLFEPA
jgi:hypothetical protein